MADVRDGVDAGVDDLGRGGGKHRGVGPDPEALAVRLGGDGGDLWPGRSA